MNGTRAFSLFCTLFIASASVAVALSVPLNPPPPGMVDHTITAYLAGEAMNGRYEIVASRLRLNNSQWQPYVTIYAQRATGFGEIYQSPSKNDALALVPRREAVPGGSLYLPTVDVHLIGKAEFMASGRQEAAVLVHQAGADCGSTALSILRADPVHGTIRLAAQVSNPCDLSAKIQGHTIVLSGPYYNATAALCCPTQAQARAILAYGAGRWTLHPAYFKLGVRGMARARIIGPIPKMTPSPASIFKSPLPSPGALQTPRP
ncbi:MAG: hypothetical protein JO177_05835 [Candidatus Eremiobacteraeota bacterium]|nr:hypothetical protein [Candidatus Eremiobacteraeota bacterium]